MTIFKVYSVNGWALNNVLHQQTLLRCMRYIQRAYSNIYFHWKSQTLFNFQRCMFQALSECELLTNPPLIVSSIFLLFFLYWTSNTREAKQHFGAGAPKSLMHTCWFYIVWFWWIEYSIHQKSLYDYLGCCMWAKIAIIIIKTVNREK